MRRRYASSSGPQSGRKGVLAVAKLAPYRPHLILGPVSLLGFGFWIAYRSQSGCIGKTCTRASAKITRAPVGIH